MNHVLDEAIGGHRVIKVYGGQDYEASRFRDAAAKVRRFLLRQSATTAAGMPVVQLVTATAVAIVIWIATGQAKAGELSVGSFVSYMLAMLMVMPPLRRLTGVTEQLQRGLAAAESVFDLIDQTPEHDPGTRSLPRAKGEVSLRGVRFSYDAGGREALSGIDLRIPPGEMLALVGASGSGKTTLANLLPRFYRAEAGQIEIDGIDVADLAYQFLVALLELAFLVDGVEVDVAERADLVLEGGELLLGSGAVGGHPAGQGARLDPSQPVQTFLDFHQGGGKG
jgi:subfamily B ATP-binding cassette protein MsbA